MFRCQKPGAQKKSVTTGRLFSPSRLSPPPYGVNHGLHNGLHRRYRLLPVILTGFLLCSLAVASAEDSAPSLPEDHHAQKDAKKRDKTFFSATQERLPIPLRVRRIIFKAERLMGAQAYEKAIALFQDYRREHPDQDHYLLAFIHGNALALSGNKQEALSRLQSAVGMAPGYGPAWINLGKVAFELEQYALAGKSLAAGFSCPGEKNPELLFSAAMAYIMDGSPLEAEPLLEELVYSNYEKPPKPWFQALLSVYLDLNQAEKAEALIKQMMIHYEAAPETWKLYGQLEINRQHYKAAVVALTIYGYLNPLSREEMILLADLYSAIKVYPKACNLYERAMALKPGSPEEFERLASAYLAAHRPEQALSILLKVLKSHQSPRLWSLLGDLRRMEKDFQGAFQAFMECARLDPQNGRAYLMQGYCALESGNRQQAVTALKKAATFSPHQKTAQQLLKLAAGD